MLSSISPADAATAGAPAVVPSVLVVEDNFGVAKALSAVLRGAGYDAVPFHCAADALNHCRGDVTPDAAVVDIHLPDLNGLVLAHKLRERLGPDAPIIVVSGDTSMETIKSLSHVGATYFFSKPVNSKLLVNQLKDLLGGASRAAG